MRWNRITLDRGLERRLEKDVKTTVFSTRNAYRGLERHVENDAKTFVFPMKMHIQDSNDVSKIMQKTLVFPLEMHTDDSTDIPESNRLDSPDSEGEARSAGSQFFRKKKEI